MALDEEVLWVEWFDGEGSLLDAMNSTNGPGGVGDGDLPSSISEDGRACEAQPSLRTIDFSATLDDAGAFPLAHLQVIGRQGVLIIRRRARWSSKRRAVGRR